MTENLHIGRELASTLPLIIDHADHSIRLAMYQLAPPGTHNHAAIARLWKSLIDAPLRGVKCTAILSDASAFLPARSAVQRSAQALANAGWAVALAPDSKLMHAKCMIVDDCVMLNGSHNWTAAGLLQNHEISTMIKTPQIVVAAAQWHEQLFWQLRT